MSRNYPTRYEFQKNESLFNLDMAGRVSPFDRLMPTVTKNVGVIAYEYSEDYGGVAQARGDEGMFRPIPKKGKRTVTYSPFAYGEYDVANETELKYNTGSNYDNSNVTINDMLFDAQERLLLRERNLLTVNKANFAFTGKVTAAKTEDPNQVIGVHDFGFTSFPVVTPWSNHTASTPLYDLMNNIKSRSQHVDWKNGRILMNMDHWWNLIQNTNSADLMGGVKAMAGTAEPDRILERLTNLLSKLGLPPIEVEDFAYINAAGTETKVIPNSSIAVIGSLRNTRKNPAEYVQTISLIKEGNTVVRRAGGYTHVVVPDEPPFVQKVFRGHDGAMACEYPEVFAPMTNILP